MKESVRNRILNEKLEYEKADKKREELINELKELAEELKESEIVKKIKLIGEEYLANEEEQIRLEEIQKKEIENIKNNCIHPLLIIVNYKKHNSSNRVINVLKEDAEYCTLKCLECGKQTFSKNNDGSDDWDKYILAPTHLASQIDVDYLKRYTFELPFGVKFKDVHEYYQEIMLDQPQNETIKKVLKKVYNKK